MAHLLGPLANRTDLFRDDLLALSERYWSGLFHCYNIVGLPRTNDHESLYGQLKRQLGQPLLKRDAWTLFRAMAISPTDLRIRLAQVRWVIISPNGPVMTAAKRSSGVGIAGSINVALNYSSEAATGLRSYLIVNVLFLP